jgi:hypothetical protein
MLSNSSVKSCSFIHFVLEQKLATYFIKDSGFCLKAIQTKNKRKGLLNSATFQIIFRAVQFICCDLQMIYDQSFCNLCVGAGNLCLVFQVIC